MDVGPARPSGLVRFLLLPALVLAPATVQAHALRLSRGEWSLEQGEAAALLTFFRGELSMLVPDGLDDAAVEAAALKRVVASVEVRTAGARCNLVRSALHLVEGDGAVIDLRRRCPAAGSQWTVRLPFLTELSSGHTHLARVTAGGSFMTRSRVRLGALTPARLARPLRTSGSRPNASKGHIWLLHIEHGAC